MPIIKLDSSLPEIHAPSDKHEQNGPKTINVLRRTPSTNYNPACTS